MENNHKSLISHVKNGIEYAISLNPNDEQQYFGRVARTAVATRNHCKHILEDINPYVSKLQLFPEYSFPMNSAKTIKGPRLHHHGTIVFSDIVGFLELGYSRLIKWTMIDLDTIAQPLFWKNYSMKDAEVMKAFYRKRHTKYGLTETIH